MKKILITTTLLLTLIAGSTASYAGSCTSNIFTGGFSCSGGGVTTDYKPNIFNGGWDYNSYSTPYGW